jgi:hypothetical protein
VFTVLHLSDLHRSPTDPISNAVLLSSLTADHSKYRGESPPCPSPDAIIVSGDIIQGVPLGTPDAASKLSAQYAVAGEFLEALVTQFLGGDRRRLVMVPGNHDVDWNTARAAMQPMLDADAPSRLGPAALASNPLLRWSWEERALYSIIDQAGYEQRLALFRSFYSDFYGHAVRRLSQIPYGYWDLFELHNGRIAVAAFNSCANNDCFRFSGQVPEDAVAGAHLAVERECESAELLVAVWHHNIEGAPDADDYLDVATVHRLIGSGFRLGLHGHQHRAQVSYRYILLPEEERMAVVSAGSLCAGQTDRPTAVNRQYNVIVLSDDLGSARIHIREMAVATVFGPALRAELGGKGYVDLAWRDEGFRRRSEAAKASRRKAAILQGERAWKEGRLIDAKTALGSIEAPSGTFERSLLLQVLEDSQDYPGIEELVGEPADIAELTLLVRSRLAAQDFAGASRALTDWSDAVGLPQPQRHDLEAVIAASEVTGTG